MIIDSVCTYCGVGCEISAEIKNNNISKIYAKKESIVSEGNLCLKGKEGYSFLYSDRRINKVLIRKKFVEQNPEICKDIVFPKHIQFQNSDFYQIAYLEAYKIVSRKISEITSKYSPKAFASIGGARTNCESSYIFQKFTREIIGSPNVDNCARVCHSPSLTGMMKTIGEGAATNSFQDIQNTEFIIIIGSNTTEAHPIVADKMLKAKKLGTLNIATIDIRETQIYKNSKYKATIPYEANLLILNMLAFTILSENLEDIDFIKSRTKYFEEYKNKILNDPYANPEFMKNIVGYEYLADELPKIAREYASKKSMIFWGLGVTENFDGSYAVMGIVHLALLTGNVGGSGIGLMPLRGQNNVQGSCDMGMLPYYNPDYEKPKEVGLMTPEVFDAIFNDEVKAIWNIGEDLAHIHPNLNRVHKALNKLDFLIVNEVMENEVTKFADIIFGVKSGYEKTGVYINAERRLHLSQPLIDSDLPDDWEILQGVEKELKNSWNYKTSKDVWSEVQKVAKKRYSGADYEKLAENRLSGLQWPIKEVDTPILHLDDFRTVDGLGVFHYHQYKLRGQIAELLKNREHTDFYLSTGRTIAHYNNAVQTKATERLLKIHSQDILLVSDKDREFFKNKKFVVLKTKFGESGKLPIRISNKIKKGTMFSTFHHPESRINFLFGEDRDELIKTAQFKSIKVKVLF